MTSSNLSNHKYRIFIGKLPLSIEEQGLWDYFTQFGEISSVSIKRNPQIKTSKGFGFLNCSSKTVFDAILGEKHWIEGTRINCNSAFKDVRTNHLGKNDQRKAFLRGINSNVTDSDLSDYFSTFGELVKVYGLRGAAEVDTKGFGFLEYLSTDPIPNILKQRFHFINGQRIETTKFSKDRINFLGGKTGKNKKQHFQVDTKKQQHYAAPENESGSPGYNNQHNKNYTIPLEQQIHGLYNGDILPENQEFSSSDSGFQNFSAFQPSPYPTFRKRGQKARGTPNTYSPNTFNNSKNFNTMEPPSSGQNQQQRRILRRREDFQLYKSDFIDQEGKRKIQEISKFLPTLYEQTLVDGKSILRYNEPCKDQTSRGAQRLSRCFESLQKKFWKQKMTMSYDLCNNKKPNYRPQANGADVYTSFSEPNSQRTHILRFRATQTSNS